MTTAMGPPPPRNATSISEPRPRTSEEPSTSESTTSSMGPPPPPKFTIPPPPETKIEPHSDTSASEDSSISENVDSKGGSSTSSTSKDKDKDGSLVRKQGHGSNDASVPYTIPPWNGPPCHQYFLEVLKDGAIIDQFEVNKKGAYMFGRVDLCDFVLEHPTISRFHAVIQFKSNGQAYLYDLGSTHGSSVNKNQVKKKTYVELHVGDVIRFGQSSRLYIFQGPTDLMPPEADLKSMRSARVREEMKDMEASLLRAKREASLADGISWGMQEDAIEEDEDEVDEITWQNFKGQLTEKQEKTREKVIKRLEKIAHMKKEIDAIRAKDIAQGGLTQGQQTQIARNEQRISQIMEELENLEETLNDSIRESLGARAGKITRGGKRRGATEDEEEDYVSDDDDFYDRTKKPPKRKSDENQSIETADSLLGKKEEILKEIENTRKLLLDEDEKVQPTEVSGEGDALDAYMSSVSSQLVLDKKGKLQKELNSLQSELDRVLYLLKIADPTGEAAKKRDSKAQEPMPDIKNAASVNLEQPPSVKSQNSRPEHLVKGSGKPKRIDNSSVDKQSIANVTAESGPKVEGSEVVTDVKDDSTIVPTVVKPQWLGAVEDLKKQETIEVAPVHMEEKDSFVDYKDRNAILENAASGIENAAPGLIIRKRKQVENVGTSDEASEKSKEAKLKVEDTVALLLKHSKVHHASEEVELQPENAPNTKHARKDKKQPKKVLGPERPSFLSNESDYDAWVPPEGQSGDGRTSLNDRYGY